MIITTKEKDMVVMDIMVEMEMMMHFMMMM